jgi:hypothetical protein
MDPGGKYAPSTKYLGSTNHGKSHTNIIKQEAIEILETTFPLMYYLIGRIESNLKVYSIIVELLFW